MANCGSTRLSAGVASGSRLGVHGREALGGSPFGDGTPPGPVRDAERAPHAILP